MQFTFSRRFSASLLAAAALAACGGEQSLSPNGAAAPVGGGQPAGFKVGVSYSSPAAARGALVELSVALDGSVPADLGALQAYLRFDDAKLEYVGLEADQSAFVTTNTGERGAIRFTTLQLPRLATDAATFVFRVKEAGYLDGLRVELEEAATSSDRVFTRAAGTFLRQSDDRDVAQPLVRSAAEWVTELEQRGFGRGAPASIAAIAGQGRVYGDVNNSNTVTSGDLVLVANAAVGNRSVLDTIVGADIASAGNVRPLNTADGNPAVRPNDPCPLGVTCSTAPFRTLDRGTISSADQLAIANFLVGNAAEGIGQAIPRADLATNPTRQIITGTINPAFCATLAGFCNAAGDTAYMRKGTIWQLDGLVDVVGINLVVQAGTRIEGNSNAPPSALVIRRNAKIFSLGQPNEPVLMTCTNPAKSKGCWGGVVVLGNAPVNEQQSGVAGAITDPVRNPTGTGNTRQIEGLAPPFDGVYGGDNAADDSGIIRYTIIEYAGFIIGANNELNGLTLGGVGHGTTVEYVQVHAGLDDGYELFGGTVNAKYLYLTGNSDDGFDWSFGWNGAAQFVIVQQDSLDAEKGLEGDNTETSGTFNNAPRTNGPLYNFTIIGTLFPSSTSGNPGNNVNDAVHIRRGNRSTVGNSIIAGFPVALDLDDAATCANAAGDPSIRNTLFIGNVVLGNTDSGDPVCELGSTEEAVITNPVAANTIVTNLANWTQFLRRPFNVIGPDFRPVAGASLPAPGAIPAARPGINGTFDAVSFIGAVAPETAPSRNNVPWYAGWTVGFQSNIAP